MSDQVAGQLPPELLEALKGYDTPTLCNAIEAFGVRPFDEGFASLDIRCLFPELGPMVGYAATAMMRARGKGGPGNQEVVYEHVQTVPSPRVVVIQDLDDPSGHGSFWGEVQSTVFKALGAVGCVTDGCVRDFKEVRAMAFHYFARGVGVSHAYNRVVASGTEVVVGGLRVKPHDLIHADQHGVLLIPTEVARDLPSAADKVVAREQRLINWVRSPDFDPHELARRRKVEH